MPQNMFGWNVSPGPPYKLERPKAQPPAGAVDDDGFAIDLSRPLVEGIDEEGRTISQTERSIGVYGIELLEQVPGLKDKIDPDAMYNIPSIWNGEEFGQSDEARKFAAEYMEDTGWVYPNYKGVDRKDTEDLALAAAKRRSDKIGKVRAMFSGETRSI